MKADKQIQIGSILSYVQNFISIAIGVIYSPIMIRMLGQSEYGLYSTVTSVISVLSILNFGLNNSYIRYYSKYNDSADEERIYRVNGCFLCIFLVLAAIAAVCGVIVICNIRLVFGAGLTSEEYRIAIRLMIMLVIQMVCSLSTCTFTSIIAAKERFVFLKLLNILKTVAGPLIILPLLFMGFRSVAMVFVTVIISIVVDMIYVYYVLVVLKEQFCFGKIETGIGRDIIIYTAFIALHLLTDQMNWQVDKILLGRFQGTQSVAVYSVGYSIYYYFIVLGTAIPTMFIPRVHSISANQTLDVEKKRSAFTEVFARVGRIQYLILGLPLSGFVLFGREFICLWVGKEYLSSYIVALLLVIPGMIDLLQNIGIEIQRAQNLHKFRAFIYVGMACINVGISIRLCQMYGTVGSAIGTAISLLLVQGLIINIYYQKKCNIDIQVFWRCVFSITRAYFPAILVGFAMKRFIAIDSWLKLIACICVYVLFYLVCIWRVGLNAGEKTFIIALVSKIRPRKI